MRKLAEETWYLSGGRFSPPPVEGISACEVIDIMSRVQEQTSQTLEEGQTEAV